LLLAAESAKITGSKSIIVSADKTGVFKYDYAEKATIEIMDRCMKIVNQLLRRNCITKIHCVLCGGSTKSKYIRDYLSKYYSISTEIDPDLAVAIGDGLAAKFMKEGSRVPVVNKMAKYFGIMLKDRFKPILNKCDIVPIAGTIFVENVVPFTNKIHVEFIQTEDLLSSYTPVYSLELNDLQGFDENGRASIRIDVTVTIDGVVSLKAANGDKVVSAVLNSIANEKSQDEAESFYLQRFRNAVKKYGFEDLNPRLEELSKNSSNRTLIKEIDRAIRSRVKSLESSF
jgi:hypothetical protein